MGGGGEGGQWCIRLGVVAVLVGVGLSLRALEMSEVSSLVVCLVRVGE